MLDSRVEFKKQHYWYFGLENSSWWRADLCVVGRLVSLTSKIPVPPPSGHSQMSLDIDKSPLENKIIPRWDQPFKTILKKCF